MKSVCQIAGIVAFVVVPCAGCGDGGPFQYIPVHGKLTYEDGQPLPAGGVVLQFLSQDAQPVDGMHPRPGSADVDAQGVFTAATSLKYGDGLIPGKHKVALFYATDKSGKLLVPREYTSFATTPLVVDTGDGNIEIKVPRP
jgi:hypothetical protein